jgi:hypothetical protein
MDATLIRMLLLPATMRLLGTFNWWAPVPLRWLWQYIGLRETAAPLAPAFHVQGNLQPIAGMPDEILAGRPYRVRLPSKPIQSSPLPPLASEKVALQDGNDVISTLTANGEEIMGPEVLLWCYPNKSIVNGSRLSVGSNQFCVLKVDGAILDVYETGQYSVRTPDSSPFGSVQLTFDDELIPSECSRH